jgi:hypothetical protein
VSEEEEEQKGKKSPAFFEARLPTIVGAGSRNWRGSPLLFSAPTDDRNARRAPVGRPFECPRALLQRKRAPSKHRHLRSERRRFDAFSIQGSFFSTALSPSKEEEENLVSRRRRPINLSSFYSPSRAPGSTRPRASRPRRRMRVRLWSRRAPGFVNQGVNGRGEREKRREEGEKAILSGAPKFGNASRRRRRRKKKNVGLLLLFPPSSPLSLSPLSHLQVTEQQERVVDLHV